MKASCNRVKLLRSFQLAAVAAATRSLNPVVQAVLLDASADVPTLIATDFVVAIRVELPELQVHERGRVLLPAERFGAILRTSNGETLNLVSEDTHVRIWDESSQFQLYTHNPDEFPLVGPFAAESYYRVAPTLLRTIVARTVFATDPAASGYALGGVLFELSGGQVTAVATDGRRMAKQEGPAEQVGQSVGESKPLVPAKAVELLGEVIGTGEAHAELAEHRSDLVVRCGRVTVRMRLLDGSFPPWRQVAPSLDGWAAIEIRAGTLLSAVRQAAIVTTKEQRGIRFSVKQGKLVLSAHTAETGRSQVEVPIVFGGAELAVTLRADFMTDFLRVLDAEQSCVIHVRGAEAPVVCTTDDGYAYTVMPMVQEQDK